MNIDDFRKRATELNEEHGDRLEGAVDKGSEFAKQRTGGHDEQIDSAADQVKSRLGGDDQQR